MATTQPQDDFQKTALRLPRDLHEKIVATAAASGRSMNAEIVSRLRASFGEGEWRRAFPNAAAATDQPDESRQSRERLMFANLQLQQLRARADTLYNQVFTLENQALTLQEALVRKMDQVSEVTGIRKKQLAGEISQLRDRLQQIDDRIGRLRAEGELVRQDIATLRGALEDRIVELANRPDGRLNVIGDKQFVESALYSAAIDWRTIDGVVVIEPEVAPRVRQLFGMYPSAVLDVLERRGRGPAKDDT